MSPECSGTSSDKLRSRRCHRSNSRPASLELDLWPWLRVFFVVLERSSPIRSRTRRPSAVWRHGHKQLGMVTAVTWHHADHYGQMTLHLHLNGIVPPASRPHSASRKPPRRRSISIRPESHRRHQDRQSLQIRGPDCFCVPLRALQQNHKPDLWAPRYAGSENHRKTVGDHPGIPRYPDAREDRQAP